MYRSSGSVSCDTAMRIRRIGRIQFSAPDGVCTNCTHLGKKPPELPAQVPPPAGQRDNCAAHTSRPLIRRLPAQHDKAAVLKRHALGSSARSAVGLKMLAPAAARIGRVAQLCNMSCRREVQEVFARMEQPGHVIDTPGSRAATVAGADATATRRAVQDVFNKMQASAAAASVQMRTPCWDRAAFEGVKVTVDEIFGKMNDCSTNFLATDNNRPMAAAEKQRESVNAIFNLINGEAAQADTPVIEAIHTQRVPQSGFLEHGVVARTATTVCERDLQPDAQW